MPEIEVNDCTPVVESLSKDHSPDELKSEEQVKDITTTVKDDTPTSEQEAENEEENEKKENEWVDVLGSGQLKMKVIRRGEPDTRPQPSDVCYIKLVGKLDNGTVVEEYDSLQIQAGEYEVVQGLDLAIPLMDVGEETIVVVGPRFAYGSIGLSPDIPPDATITYTIELLKVDLEPELDKVSFENRKLLANSKRQRGNWWYGRHDPTKAIQCYRKSLDVLDDTVPHVDEDGNTTDISQDFIKESMEIRLKVYNNLAAAQLMIQAYDSALTSVEHVILVEPRNVKALFRKAKILAAKGSVNDAVETLRVAIQLEPENNAIKTELNRCLKIQQEEKKHEKNLYKKMLGQDKKEDRTSQKPQTKYSTWTKVLGTAATATVMALIAVAVGFRYKNYSFL